MKKVISKLKSLFKKKDGLTLPKCNTDEYLYAFKYNPDTFDGCAEIISIHKTYKGAYKNLRRFLLDKHEQWLELPKKYRELYCIEHGEHYFISKIKLKD